MTTTTFGALDLCDPLLQALEAENYTTPTPIQAAAIPHILAGRDLMGCAQTGTGKTAAFALPILQRLDRDRRPAAPHNPRVLVLAPTRELAAQIAESFSTYGKNVRCRQTVIYGGVGQNPQVRALARGVHTVVATPGRLVDLLEQRHIFLKGLEVFVLDEADRMLDMGFLPDLKRIMAALPAKRQSLFFTATLPPRITELAEGLLTDPVRVSVTPSCSTVDRIEQRVMFVDRKQKRALLRQVLTAPDARRILVFAKTKRGANDLAEYLGKSGIESGAIHGNKSQAARERALKGFRAGQIRVLVATDLAARGLDVDDITHVVNFDLPIEPESYVHRIGRTGRAGADGIALTLCDASERGALRAIERLIRQPIPVDAAHALPAAVLSRGPGGQENGQRDAAPRNGFAGRKRRPNGRPPFAAKQHRRGPSKRRQVSASR